MTDKLHVARLIIKAVFLDKWSIKYIEYLTALPMQGNNGKTSDITQQNNYQVISNKRHINRVITGDKHQKNSLKSS